MKYIIMLTLLLTSCNNKKPIPIIQTKDSGSFLVKMWDSTDSVLRITPPTDFILDTSTLRYWLITYETKIKDDVTSRISGNLAFSSYGFFNKNEFDKEIYKELPYDKDAYEHIIISYIYEFNKDEYNTYRRALKGDKEFKKKLPIHSEHAYNDSNLPIIIPRGFFEVEPSPMNLDSMYRRIDSIIKSMDTLVLEYN